MNWITGIQRAINYIEDHVEDDIDIAAAAREATSSPFHFQRMFSMLTGITLGDYIRMRRLSLAAAGSCEPSHDLSRVQCPVWAVNGAKDLQVLPEENLKAIETLAKGSPQVVTHIYPGLNHLFMEAPTGHPSEYGLLQGNFSQEVLQDMAEWIRKTVGICRSRRKS